MQLVGRTLIVGGLVYLGVQLLLVSVSGHMFQQQLKALINKQPELKQTLKTEHHMLVQQVVGAMMVLSVLFWLLRSKIALLVSMLGLTLWSVVMFHDWKANQDVLLKLAAVCGGLLVCLSQPRTQQQPKVKTD